MKVLVCGGRDYKNRQHVFQTLDLLLIPETITYLIHGGARGVDSIAHDWASEHGVRIKQFNANWQKHGRAAGPIRNQEMLEYGKPDFVIAFPGGRGTADMIQRTIQASVKLIRVPRV